VLQSSVECSKYSSWCRCVAQEETGETLPPLEDGRFVVGKTAQVGSLTYESTLMIHNTSKADYSLYKCIASNELGTDTALIALHGTSE
jgi:Immunoglobulin I-set domain